MPKKPTKQQQKQMIKEGKKAEKKKGKEPKIELTPEEQKAEEERIRIEQETARDKARVQLRKGTKKADKLKDLVEAEVPDPIQGRPATNARNLRVARIKTDKNLQVVQNILQKDLPDTEIRTGELKGKRTKQLTLEQVGILVNNNRRYNVINSEVYDRYAKMSDKERGDRLDAERARINKRAKERMERGRARLREGEIPEKSRTRAIRRTSPGRRSPSPLREQEELEKRGKGRARYVSPSGARFETITRGNGGKRRIDLRRVGPIKSTVRLLRKEMERLIGRRAMEQRGQDLTDDMETYALFGDIFETEAELQQKKAAYNQLIKKETPILEELSDKQKAAAMKGAETKGIRKLFEDINLVKQELNRFESLQGAAGPADLGMDNNTASALSRISGLVDGNAGGIQAYFDNPQALEAVKGMDFVFNNIDGGSINDISSSLTSLYKVFRDTSKKVKSPKDLADLSPTEIQYVSIDALRGLEKEGKEQLTEEEKKGITGGLNALEKAGLAREDVISFLNYNVATQGAGPRLRQERRADRIGRLGEFISKFATKKRQALNTINNIKNATVYPPGKTFMFKGKPTDVEGQLFRPGIETEDVVYGGAESISELQGRPLPGETFSKAQKKGLQGRMKQAGAVPNVRLVIEAQGTPPGTRSIGRYKPFTATGSEAYNLPKVSEIVSIGGDPLEVVHSETLQAGGLQQTAISRGPKKSQIATAAAPGYTGPPVVNVGLGAKSLPERGGLGTEFTTTGYIDPVLQQTPTVSNIGTIVPLKTRSEATQRNPGQLFQSITGDAIAPQEQIEEGQSIGFVSASGALIAPKFRDIIKQGQGVDFIPFGQPGFETDKETVSTVRAVIEDTGVVSRGTAIPGERSNRPDFGDIGASAYKYRTTAPAAGFIGPVLPVDPSGAFVREVKTTAVYQPIDAARKQSELDTWVNQGVRPQVQIRRFAKPYTN